MATTNTVTAEKFACFVRQLPWERGATLIMDTHKTAAVRAAFAERGYSVAYCPPYSPDMNPIENVFSFVKSVYRKSHADPDVERRVEAAMRSVRPDLQRRCFDHLRGLLLRPSA